MPTKLSILIPSIPERRESLSKLLAVLYLQMRPEVEVIINVDSKNITLGAKENRLLEAAKGEYVVFMDDDDMIKPDYISSIFEGIEKGVDIVQIQTDYFIHGVWTALITFRLGNDWVTENDQLYRRGCAKFCPHKRELALKVMFEDINLVEDRAYAKGLDALCKTEHLIDHPVYEYRYNP